MTRSRLINIGSLSLAFIVAGSCQHKSISSDQTKLTESQAGSSAISIVNYSEAPSSASLSLNQVVETNYLHVTNSSDYERLTAQAQFFADSYRLKGIGAATEAVCKADSQSSLCKAFSFEQTADRKTKKSLAGINIRKLTQDFRKGNFSEFDQASLDQSLKALKPLSNAALLAGANSILAKSDCRSSGLLMALGSKLEDGFPQTEYVEAASAVYSKASSCHSDESATRAAYRNGMILVWQNKCEQANPEFDKVLQNKNLSFLHTRSSHWKNHCAALMGQKVDKDPESNYHQNPLSFHSIVAFNENQEAVFEKIKSNPEPNVLLRSNKQASLNDFVAAAELMLAINEVSLARTALSFPESGDFDQSEVEFRLYVSYLMHRSLMNIPKFQLLSKVFVEQPNTKSLTSLKLFYPLWYYDEVSAKSDSLDPFLIISLIRQESAFNPRAQSRAGAMGLMQLLPSTARRVASVPKSKLFEPDQNLKAGVRFFGQLMRKYNNRTYLALAAYNAGPNVVDRWITRYPTDNDLLFMDLIPYRETREYAAIILRNYYWYSRLYPQDQLKQVALKSEVDSDNAAVNLAPADSKESNTVYESIDADGLIYFKDRF